MAADLMVDANGAAITVGATVKLVGTVVELNPFSTKFRSVTITLLHPTVNVPDDNVASGAQRAGATPGAVKTISVHPSMLVVGA